MISENPEGFSGSRLDVCILSFVGRSGAETSKMAVVTFSDQRARCTYPFRGCVQLYINRTLCLAITIFQHYEYIKYVLILIKF